MTPMTLVRKKNKCEIVVKKKKIFLIFLLELGSGSGSESGPDLDRHQKWKSGPDRHQYDAAPPQHCFCSDLSSPETERTRERLSGRGMSPDLERFMRRLEELPPPSPSP
jgi:hypothetical protein